MGNAFASKRVICFDMNDTLSDERQSFDQNFLNLLGEYTRRWEHDGHWTPQSALDTYHRLWLRRKAKAGKNATLRRDIRQSCLGEALTDLPIDTSPAFLKMFLQQVKRLQKERPQLVPGVRQVLEYLASNHTLAVISNGDAEKQAKRLETLGIADLIPADKVFASAAKDLRKPHPAAFIRAVRQLGATQEEAVMVGNSWANDIVGAARAGMDAIWIHPDHKDKNSRRRLGNRQVVVVRSFEHIRQLF
jgi:putative hydrolase of the HAD superfamily